MKKYILTSIIAVLAVLCSCSETEVENNEYHDWQARNDAYFEKVYQQAKSDIQNGGTEWSIIKSYAKDSTEGKHTDYIVCHKLPNISALGVSPISTDSVKIHYSGRLMPSDSYPEGLKFDSSWTGAYNAATMIPYKATAGTFIDGFSTALYHMREGERWMVYIPESLAYKASGSGSSIPGYSMLVFDITLVDVY